MATLKQHQEAMVQLLANGSGIPASASRLAHAMHDVLSLLTTEQLVEAADWRCLDATTPGLNDRALAEDIKAVRPKQVSAEQRVKQLENTVKQLRETNSRLRGERDMLYSRLLEHEHPNNSAPAVKLPEQSGVRKDDTQVWEPECDHAYSRINMVDKTLECGRCGHNVPWPDDFSPEPSKAPK